MHRRRRYFVVVLAVLVVTLGFGVIALIASLAGHDQTTTEKAAMAPDTVPVSLLAVEPLPDDADHPSLAR